MRPVCLITGASAGIGAALTRVFAEHGHELVLTARRVSQLDSLAGDIAAAGHPRPHVIAADLAAAEGVAALADAMRDLGVEPAFVVNNAGYGLLGRADRNDTADTLAMIDLNCRAMTDLSLRFVDSVTRHQGGILNVASIAAFLPGPGMAVYHATKAYVLSLSEALHQELRNSGVRVCALCPGPVDTEFNGRAGIPRRYFPSYLRISAAQVAQDGYAGLMGNARVVVPGALNRLVALLPRLLPRGPILAAMGYRWRRAGSR